MQISQLATYNLPRTANAPVAGKSAPPVQEEPADRIEAFYTGAANTAKWMSRIDGAVLGGVIGLAVGATVGAAVFGAGGTGMGSFLIASGLAVGGGAGGYTAFDRLSAFGGKIGRGLDEGNDLRGEALGRVGVNMGLSLLAGNWRAVALNAAIPLVGGAVNYALAGDR